MDPDSGAKPPEGGASAAPRGEGKSSRRRKAKRNGKRRDAAPVSHSDAVDSAAPAGRPHSQAPSPSARKRKRRRAKSVGARQSGQGSNTAPAAQQVSVRA